jgi:PAS domain S-box-containing protein
MDIQYLSTSDRALIEARETLLQSNAVPADKLRPVIARAWERCLRLGVDPRFDQRPHRVSDDELRVRLRRDDSLLRAAAPFMESLYQFVQSSGFVVLLADADACMLKIIGTENTDAKAAVYHVPGAIWKEEYAGNTAIGMALIEGVPLQIHALEHYCEALHPWTCSAAPIRDPDGALIGVLDMSGERELVHCHTLGMVVAAVTAIENQMAMDRAARELKTANTYKTAIVEAISEGLLTVDGQGLVTYMNPAGIRILGLEHQEVIGRHIRDVVEYRPDILNVLASGEGYTDREFFHKTSTRNLHLIKTAVPIRDENGGIVGVVDVFREAKRVRQMVNQMIGAQATFTFDDFVGRTPEIQDVLRLARAAADSSSNVLIQGESGTGKEILAQAIHTGSRRKEGPFVAVNCAAIPRELIESELFGHEEGAFTGARRGGRPGKFELANGGTIFLDEIGDMPPDMQVKLLRVLQERKLVRVGGSNYIDINVRVIAATNCDLQAEVEDGNFRRDLYYRLNVLLITMVPLRHWLEDLPLLVDHIIGKLNRKLGKSIKGAAPAVIERLRRHSWPGNVRELENVLERAMHVGRGDLLDVECLPKVGKAEGMSASLHQGGVSIDEVEKVAIAKTMEAMEGNISRAARVLRISRNTLYSKIRRYGLQS